MADQMTNDGTESGANAVRSWVAPLAYGRVLTVPKKGTDEWTVVIEMMDLPGAVAVPPGETVEHAGDGVFRLVRPSSSNLGPEL